MPSLPNNQEENRNGRMGEQPQGSSPAPIAALTSTAISQSQFLSWKRQKEADAAARKAEASRKREEDIAAGLVQMNGRELFQHEPWVINNTLY